MLLNIKRGIAGWVGSMGSINTVFSFWFFIKFDLDKDKKNFNLLEV